MDYKKKVIDILKYDVNLMENENRTEINIDNINEVAEQIVKLFAIPVVMQRSELLLFADYSESDKTSQTTDECVDNYLAQKQ